MIDIKLLREDFENLKKKTADKQVDPSIVEKAKDLDEKRRNLIQQVEALRSERNKISKEKADKSNKRGKEIKEELKKLDPELKKAEAEFEEAFRQIPNPAADDVKVGKNDTENEVLKTWGTPRKFDFSPKDHVELGEALDIIDIKRAAKVSGTRFAYLKGDGALLEFAIIQFAKDTLLSKGFIPVIPPVLIKKSSMEAMGYLEHGGEEDMFVFDKDDLVLVGTSEQSIGPIHMDEILPSKELPRRYMGFSTCFRREAGSYGKDTKGIIRVHQFDKIEMFSFTKPEEGDKEHEFLLSVEEELFQALGIPYQLTKMVTGDLGAPAARKYDINAWIPTQEKYREVTSTSTTTDFQARRLNIKYAEKGETKFVHTLNGTAFAVGRTIVAILENYQEKDGTVGVPEVLRKYMGKDKITPK